MKKYISNFVRRTLLVFMLMAGSAIGYSQIQNPGGVDDEPTVPIDGFLSIGLIAGTAYGAYKLLRKKE